MNKNGKTGILFLLLLVVISAAAAAYLYLEWDKSKKQVVTLQAQVTDLEAKKQEIDKKYKDTLAQVEDLNNKVKDAEARVASLTEDVDTANKSKEEALLEVSKSKEEMDKLLTAKQNLEKDLASAKKELETVKSKIKLEEQTKKGTAVQNDSKSDVQLDKIVLSPVSNQSAPTEAKGRVLVVNKEYDFAVVNLGQGDNIKIGDKLQVIRDGQVIGSLQIEEIRPTMSVAKFDNADIKEKIKEGDSIAF